MVVLCLGFGPIRESPEDMAGAATEGGALGEGLGEGLGEVAGTTAAPCFTLSRVERLSSVEVGSGWLVGAVLAGLLLGALVAFLVFRFALRRCWERDEEEAEEEHGPSRPCLRFLFPFCFYKRSRPSQVQPSESGRFKYGRLREEAAGPDTPPPEALARRESEPSAAPPGLSDALAELDPDPVAAALQNQEVQAAAAVEDGIVQARNELSQPIVAATIAQASSEGEKVSAKAAAYFKERLEETSGELAREQEAVVAQLRDAKPGSEDEAALQQLLSETRKRRHEAVKSCLEDLEGFLSTESGMEEGQVTAVMAKLAGYLARLEEHLNRQMDFEAQILQRRAANRRYLASQVTSAADGINKQIEDYEKAAEKILRSLHSGKALSEATETGLLQELSRSMRGLVKGHRKRVKAALAEKERKLGRLREEGLGKVERRRAEGLERAGRGRGGREALETAADLLRRDAEAREAVWDELDKDEAAKLRATILQLEEEWKAQLNEESRNMLRKLKKEARINSAEVKALDRELEAEVGELNRIREMENKVATNDAKEKAEKAKRRPIQWGETTEFGEDEEGLESKMSGLLAALPDVDESEKEAMLAEARSQRTLVDTMLKLERLRAEKAMKAKLGRRRASLAASKAEKEAKQRKVSRSVKEARKLSAFAQEDWRKEEAELEEEKERMRSELKERLKEETRRLKAGQDEAMASLIGRLQVSQARRAALAERQSGLVKRLEALRRLQLEMEERAKSSASQVEPERLDQLLQEHRAQVAALNDSLDSTRQRQLDKLRHRLEAKRSERASELDGSLRSSAESGDVLTRSLKGRSGGLGRALLADRQTELRRRKAQAELDAAVESEMGKGRRKLNAQLHQELQKSLVDQKKQFLGQMAAILRMSPGELSALSSRNDRRTLTPSPPATPQPRGRRPSLSPPADQRHGRASYSRDAYARDDDSSRSSRRRGRDDEREPRDSRAYDAQRRTPDGRRLNDHSSSRRREASLSPESPHELADYTGRAPVVGYADRRRPSPRASPRGLPRIHSSRPSAQSPTYSDLSDPADNAAPLYAPPSPTLTRKKKTISFDDHHLEFR